MSDSVPATYSQLPIQTLIGAPFLAANEANGLLAQNMINFVNQIGFVDVAAPPGAPTGTPSTKTAALLQFQVTTPASSGSKAPPPSPPPTPSTPSTTPTVTNYNFPLLSLVPIPSLLVETVEVEFSMAVYDNSATSSEVKGEATLEAAYKSFWGGVNFKGTLAATKNSSQSQTQNANYQIRARASQQPPTPGMMALVELLQAAVKAQT